MYLLRDGSDISKIKDLKDEDGKLVLSGATDDDYRIIRRVCEAVSTRAARLAAAGVVALVRKVLISNYIFTSVMTFLLHSFSYILSNVLFYFLMFFMLVLSCGRSIRVF